MKKIKYILIFLVFFNSTLYLSAQRIKYKDIYEVILSGDNILAYSLLFEYQKQDPEFANTYFQLGLISYYNIKEADPFLDYKKIKYYYYNIHLFWGLAKKKIEDDHSEVVGKRKYFQNVQELAQISRLNAEDVLEFINYRMKEIDEYVKELDKIYGLFYAMVDSYTMSVSYFRNIISEYKKIKDLYLAPESEIITKLDTLRTFFDTTMNKYELYKAAIASYPLKDYNQSVILRPITLYRLEGVTNTDFLQDTMLFWNYNQWVKDIKNVIITDILNLRVNIEKYYNFLSAHERKLLKEKVYSDDFSGYNLPIKIIYQIEKYDLNSIVSNILKYKKIKTDFLAFRLHKYNDTTDTLIKLVVRANSYNREQQVLTQLDSLLNQISLLDKPSNVEKFQKFFEKHFSAGVQSFIRNEKQQINKLYYSDKEHFKYFIFRDIFYYPFDSSFVIYNRDTINLFISQRDLAKYITMDVKRDPFHNVFVGGVMSKNNKQYVFISKVSKNIVQWIKTIPVDRQISIQKLILFPYSDGVVVDIYNVGEDGRGFNKVYRFDQTGNKGFSFESDVSYIPRFIFYDDINNFLLLGYKGNDKNKSYTTEPLTLEKWNTAEEKRVWRYSFEYTGDFVNMIRFDSIYYAFVNFKNFTTTTGEKYTYQSNKLGLIRITETGKVLPFKVLEEEQFYLIHTIKLNSEKFELLGFEKFLPGFRILKFDDLPALEVRILNKF